MKTKNYKKKFTLFIMFMIIYILLLLKINNHLEIYNPNVIIYLIIVMIIYLLSLLYKKEDISIISSIFIIIGFLFLRNVNERNLINDYIDNKLFFNFNFYLFYWIKHLNNLTILINIIGNIFIFIPLNLAIYIKIKKIILTFFITIIIIIFLELIQALLHLGIFDIVDITLNIFGIFILTIGEQYEQQFRQTKN